MASTIRIAGVDYPDVPGVHLLTPQGVTVPFADVSGDTVTADGLLYTMNAHKADGSLVTGELIDGYTHYSLNILNAGTVDSHINLKDWYLDLGFVPKFFMLYALDEYFELGPRARVTLTFYNRLKMSKSGSASTLNRLLFSAQWTDYPPRSYSYASTAGVNPYDENGVKGVHGFSTSTTTTFRLIGLYRYIAIG